MVGKKISVVYMVAGLSSRFGGKIKSLVQVGPNNEALIEVSMQQAIKAGFNKIVFVVGNSTEKAFREKFGNSFKFKGKTIPVFYAKQNFDPSERDKPWGSCEAAVSAKPFLKEPFVVCNGDDIYGEEAFQLAVNWIKKNNSPAIVAYELRNVLPEKGSNNRGIISLDKKGNIEKIAEILNIEKSALAEKGLKENDLCSMNFYGLLPETLSLLEKRLLEFKSAHKEDRKAECYLPAELSNLIKQKNVSIKLLKTNYKPIGITNPGDEETVRAALSSGN